jgi:hypothetical protein
MSDPKEVDYTPVPTLTQARRLRDRERMNGVYVVGTDTDNVVFENVRMASGAEMAAWGDDTKWTEGTGWSIPFPPQRTWRNRLAVRLRYLADWVEG